MVSLDDEFHFVAASAERAVRRQRAACEIKAGVERKRGDGLAHHLDLYYAATSSQIERRVARYDEALDDTMREDAILEMRGILHDAKKAQLHLDWLTATRTPPLDLGTRYFVESVARDLIADDVELTFVSATKGSYETTSDPWEKTISRWGEGIPDGEPTVVVIFLPRREQSAGLLHPLILHELGHAAISRHRLVKAVWEAAGKRARFTQHFTDAVSSSAKEQKLDSKTAADLVASRLTARLTETLCDCIAVHCLGPTYLYSFLVEVAAGNMDFPGDMHPPPRQRIRRQLDDLARAGWSTLMVETDPRLDEWVRHQAMIEPGADGLELFLQWAIEELGGEIRKVAQRQIGKDRLFTPESDEFNEVEQLLAAEIPPAQRLDGQPIRREQIILACWCAALRKGGGGVGALPNAAERTELAEILPAALELSAVAGAWRKS